MDRTRQTRACRDECHMSRVCRAAHLSYLLRPQSRTAATSTTHMCRDRDLQGPDKLFFPLLPSLSLTIPVPSSSYSNYPIAQRLKLKPARFSCGNLPATGGVMVGVVGRGGSARRCEINRVQHAIPLPVRWSVCVYWRHHHGRKFPKDVTSTPDTTRYHARTETTAKVSGLLVLGLCSRPMSTDQARETVPVD